MHSIHNPTLEDWFVFWTQELIERGYILKVLKASEMAPFVLFEGLKNTYNEKVTKKGKTVYVERVNTLLEPIQYTPDFTIIWSSKAKGIFYIPFEQCSYSNTKLLGFTHNGLDYTAIEIKAPPGYGAGHSSDASFRVKQKWTWEKYKILVQKVYLYPLKPHPKSDLYLWQNTFTPTRYFTTDKMTKTRTIRNWAPVTLDEFIAKSLSKN